MKRCLILIFVLIVSVILSCISVSADNENDLGDVSGAYSLGDNLPDDVKKSLEEIGVSSEDFSTISNLSFGDILTYLSDVSLKEAKVLLPSVCSMIAVLLLYALFSGMYSNATSVQLNSVLSVVSALSISCILMMPVVSLVKTAASAIETSSNFMLAFIPVMTAIMVSSGSVVSSSGYASLMLIAAEGVSQFFSKVISPLLCSFLALGISSSLVPEIKTSGIVNFFLKTVKWFMSFVFTLFTALLSLRTIYGASVDNVSSKAVRYTMSSFVPVVGGALSEAYRTVHGSVGVLKSGVGIFVIIAVFAVFLPVLIRLILWLLTINLCKCFAETSDLSSPFIMLSHISSVLSLLLSVIICIIALFVISTALVLTTGGSS